jgi:hypothetical protein
MGLVARHGDAVQHEPLVEGEPLAGGDLLDAPRDLIEGVDERHGQRVVLLRHPAQAYLILCAAPIEGRISGIVDIPNACCSLYLPTGIVDVDIRPSGDGPTLVDRGQCATAS